MTKLFMKHKASIGSQEQQQPDQRVVNTTVRHSDGLVESCSCPTIVQDTLPSHWNASTLPRGDQWSPSLTVSVASLEITFATAAAVDLLLNNQNFNLDAHNFNAWINKLLCRQKFLKEKCKITYSDTVRLVLSIHGSRNNGSFYDCKGGFSSIIILEWLQTYPNIAPF